MNRQKGSVPLIVVLVVIIVAISAVGYLLWGQNILLLNQNKNTSPSTFEAADSSLLKTEYSNPFDQKTEYSNPFSDYNNPFDSLAE